jgi:hypothetical protein
MSSRLKAATLLAVVAGLLALAETVWFAVFLGGSSDGPAFVMALVAVVLVPTLLAGMGAVLFDAIPRRPRIAAVAAVAASGLAAAGVEAGVFVADDPADPAFIHWAAALPPFALVSAVLLAGLAAWGPLRPLPSVARIILTVVAAVAGPVVLAVVLLLGMPLVMLGALAAPVALASVVLARRQRHATT